MSKSEDQLKEQFDRNLDAHLSILRTKDAHRVVNLGSRIAPNTIDVKAYKT